MSELHADMQTASALADTNATAPDLDAIERELAADAFAELAPSAVRNLIAFARLVRDERDAAHNDLDAQYQLRAQANRERDAAIERAEQAEALAKSHAECRAAETRAAIEAECREAAAQARIKTLETLLGDAVAWYRQMHVIEHCADHFWPVRASAALSQDGQPKESA